MEKVGVAPDMTLRFTAVKLKECRQENYDTLAFKPMGRATQSPKYGAMKFICILNNVICNACR